VGGADNTAEKEDHEGMTNTLDSSTRSDGAASPIAPGPGTEIPPLAPYRSHSAGHVVAIVIGCLMLLPGLGILTGGGAIALAQAVATDDDGYFNFTLDRVESDGIAVATTHLWLADIDDEAGPWLLDWLDLDVRLRVDGADATDQVFVGIARSADVERYLSQAAYSEVIELDQHTPTYLQHRGNVNVGSPLEQDFWAASAAGSGEQELLWDARGGRWAVVVMNADGSPAMAADIEIGARSGAVTPIAITLIVIGTIVSGIAIALIVIGSRGRRNGGIAKGSRPANRSPFPPPPPNTAIGSSDQTSHPTPIV
jgi:hypothetical protein